MAGNAQYIRWAYDNSQDYRWGEDNANGDCPPLEEGSDNWWTNKTAMSTWATNNNRENEWWEYWYVYKNNVQYYTVDYE